MTTISRHDFGARLVGECTSQLAPGATCPKTPTSPCTDPDAVGLEAE